MSLPENPANEIEFHFQLYPNLGGGVCGKAIPRLFLEYQKQLIREENRKEKERL
jgi:hypothetical protein